MTAERYISQYAEEFMKLDRKFWNYEDGCPSLAWRPCIKARAGNAMQRR